MIRAPGMGAVRAAGNGRPGGAVVLHPVGQWPRGMVRARVVGMARAGLAEWWPSAPSV